MPLRLRANPTGIADANGMNYAYVDKDYMPGYESYASAQLVDLR